jgi:hypothetical protein
MDTSIYEDDNYCFKEIHEARKVMTNTFLFTREAAEGLTKGLGIMYLYCNDDIKDIVLSTIEELSFREFYI